MLKYFLSIYCIYTFLTVTGQELEPENQDVTDTTKLSINAWELTDNYTKTHPVKIDTLLTEMQLYNPVFRTTKSAAYTGNLGDPAMSNIFFQRNCSRTPHFMKPYKWYYREPGEIHYYNTTKPFTEFGYSFVPGVREKDEQTADVIHTQNVNPAFNVGFKYSYINARGQYKNQRNTIGQATFFSSFRGNKYEIHGNANIGKFTNQYNGGIPDSLFFDVDISDSKDYPVNLKNASSLTKSRSMLISQKLYLGPKLPEDDTVGFKRKDAFAFISHTFEANLHKRSFTDDIGGGISSSDLAFYDTTYFNEDITNDSTYYHSFKNFLSLEFFEKQKYFLPVGLNVGIQNELERYYTSTQDTTNTFLPGKSNNFFNTALVANAYHQTGKVLNWKAKAGLFFTGRKADDYFLNGDILSTVQIKNTTFNLKAAAEILKTTPGFFYKNLVSNHFIWDNGFTDINRRELQGELSNDDYKFRLGINAINIDNFIYFDESAKPTQTSIPLSILALYLKKRFDIWKMVWDNEVHYQASDRNQILAIPELTVYSSLYLDHVIRFKFTNGAIFFQIGADVFYDSEFYGFKFMPVFEQYYVQNEKKIGDYIFIDPFLNVRIKRTRVYLKYENVGAFFFDKKYFSAVNHPRNLGVFKFGLYWTFYD